MAMVEGNHRLAACAMLLNGSTIQSKTTPFPFQEDDKRLGCPIPDTSHVFRPVSFDLYVCKPDVPLPTGAMRALSSSIQQMQRDQLGGQFVRTFAKNILQHENSLPLQQDATRYVTQEAGTPASINVFVANFLKQMFAPGTAYNTRIATGLKADDVAKHFMDHFYPANAIVADGSSVALPATTPVKKVHAGKKKTPGSSAKKKKKAEGNTTSSFFQDKVLVSSVPGLRVASIDLVFDSKCHVPMQTFNLFTSSRLKSSMALQGYFQGNNPGPAFGMCDLLTIFYHFPEVRKKYQALASKLSDESKIHSVECFLLAIIVPALQMGEIFKYLYFVSIATKAFYEKESTNRRPDPINPTTEDQRKRFNKRQEDLAKAPALEKGKNDGLNDDGSVTILKKGKSEWETLDGPLQLELEQQMRFSNKADQGRIVKMLGTAATMMAFMDLLCDHADGKLDMDNISAHLKLFTLMVYTKGMCARCFGPSKW